MLLHLLPVVEQKRIRFCNREWQPNYCATLLIVQILRNFNLKKMLIMAKFVTQTASPFEKKKVEVLKLITWS
jgi:hypothetical protein